MVKHGGKKHGLLYMLVTFSVKRPGLMATNREILYMVGKTSERPWFTVYVSDI